MFFRARRRRGGGGALTPEPAGESAPRRCEWVFGWMALTRRALRMSRTAASSARVWARRRSASNQQKSNESFRYHPALKHVFLFRRRCHWRCPVACLQAAVASAARRIDSSAHPVTNERTTLCKAPQRVASLRRVNACRRLREEPGSDPSRTDKGAQSPLFELFPSWESAFGAVGMGTALGSSGTRRRPYVKRTRVCRDTPPLSRTRFL